MEIEKIYSGDDRFDALNAIYTEAFPPQERFGLDIMLRLADEGKLDVFALMDSGEAAGMVVMCLHGHTAYVCYFAIDKALRGKGLGSEVISSICSHYAGRQIVLEIEALDKSAENYPQRKRREEFYLRAGFRHTDRYIRYEG
ncbi:MAG: GNAT family N-acetyltransferase, partial [Ruminococcus sp.]|nr:GNAT family N-acetyltransferase [Ruminococcus sp.]